MSICKVTPFDTYKCYLSLKNHFTKSSYDYFKYCGKSRSTLNTFYKRTDRFWFEKLSRQKSDQEVVNFFVSNFVSCSDPETLWVGDIVKEGEENYKKWQKKMQSLSYLFREECMSIFQENKFEEVFKCPNKGHPILLIKYLTGNISLETMVILDKIFMFSKNFDKKLQDPVWKLVSQKIKKYNPFINIDVFHYKKILKNILLEDK